MNLTSPTKGHCDGWCIYRAYVTRRFQAFRPYIRPGGRRREKGGDGVGRERRMGQRFELATEKSLQISGRICDIYQCPMRWTSRI
ncbi:hypothetical protein PoB_000474000 [Plakobranchus ocellatus]|uniref:Uncharacterized protein n=1 Tax=Plakobranchus ocellatus TaxID=259542 RepID=A0AAV3Y6Y4_9GAST|nr:hypothetical protein PoB_000474000 [Plakobranchus ocellatus]